MNRSIALVGVGLILVGFALISSPIVLFGHETFNLEQEAGILLVPVSLLVVLIGGVQPNPERTTVGGTFGNPEVQVRRPPAPKPVEAARALGYSLREPVSCRHCRTMIAFDLALCPRCARPRQCRSCARTLGTVDDRTDCPGCHRIEAFCNCPRLTRPTEAGPVPYARPRRG